MTGRLRRRDHRGHDLDQKIASLAAGESLADHEVHERAWLVVVDGEVEVETSRARAVPGGWSSSPRESVTR
jgi:hypothetical protein